MVLAAGEPGLTRQGLSKLMARLKIDRTDPSRERSGPDRARLVGLRAARGWIGCDRVRRPASPNRIQTPKTNVPGGTDRNSG